MAQALTTKANRLHPLSERQLRPQGLAGLAGRILALSDQWLDDPDIVTLADINEGLCADFAAAVSGSLSGVETIGVYDPDDLACLGSMYSTDFEQAVRRGDIGHTCIRAGGAFYDAECPSGVPLFEQLPCIQRSINP